MLVYDITNYSSFENLDDWLAIIQRECFKSDITPPHLALVANKSGQHYYTVSKSCSTIASTHCNYFTVDLEHMRTVRKERHNKYAQEHHMSRYVLVSAALLRYLLSLILAVTLSQPRQMI